MNDQICGDTVDVHVPGGFVCGMEWRYVLLQCRYWHVESTWNGLMIIDEVILIQSVLKRYSSVDEAIHCPRVDAITWK